MQALRDPPSVIALELHEWDLLLRQVGSAGLLSRLAVLLEAEGLLDRIPSRPMCHLASALHVARAHERLVHWELACIGKELAAVDTPLILLKGAAYLFAGLPPGQGRIFADIDVMVAKDALPAVERALQLHGWISMHQDPYDQHYYRQWMHELPPLRHIKRKTVLDVHHTILPETARLHPDPVKLIDAAVVPQENNRWQVLAPVDMLLHSATHLFHDGELENGLRDLLDIDALLCHFGHDAAFWQKLMGRADELELTRPLYYALHYRQVILGAPVPDDVRRSAQAGRPIWLVALMMDWLFVRGLAPDHSSCDTYLTGLARWLLYVRSHALRMPMRLLIPHLTRKAFRRRSKSGQ